MNAFEQLERQKATQQRQTHPNQTQQQTPQQASSQGQFYQQYQQNAQPQQQHHGNTRAPGMSGAGMPQHYGAASGNQESMQQFQRQQQYRQNPYWGNGAGMQQMDMQDQQQQFAMNGAAVGSQSQPVDQFQQRQYQQNFGQNPQANQYGSANAPGQSIPHQRSGADVNAGQNPHHTFSIMQGVQMHQMQPHHAMQLNLAHGVQAPGSAGSHAQPTSYGGQGFHPQQHQMPQSSFTNPMGQGQGPSGQNPAEMKAATGKRSRWGQPISGMEVQEFESQFMPWVVEQRRRAEVSSDRNAHGVGGSSDATNLLKQKEEQKLDKFAAIEQTQQYKQLLRQNPSAAAAMKAGVKCPERLAIYIERAFSKCISDTEREFMRQQLWQICTASKTRGDFFIKQWELMPLPCLQRESTSFQTMNDRLIRGDSNTSVPFPQQMSPNANAGMRPGAQGGAEQAAAGWNGQGENRFAANQVGAITQQLNQFNRSASNMSGQRGSNVDAQAHNHFQMSQSASPFTQYVQESNAKNNNEHGGFNKRGMEGFNRDGGQSASSNRDHDRSGRDSANRSNYADKRSGAAGHNQYDRQNSNSGKLNLLTSRNESHSVGKREMAMRDSNDAAIGGGQRGQNGNQASTSHLELQHQASNQSEMEMFKRLKRLEKFEQWKKEKQSKPNLLKGAIAGNQAGLITDDPPNELDELARNLAIKGTCTQVEKTYFRLTQAPDPSDVRPEPILRQALVMLTQKWADQKADYKYIDDQFRSLRQDMTVQRVQNDFCVKVYETHARIALQQADLDQFNQCQTQLRYLYQLGFKGKRIEFLAYQFLYYVFCELETETTRMLKTLTVEETKKDAVQHALKVRKSLAQGNYGRFFKLYKSAPNMAGSLIDVFIDKIRILALQKLAVGYMATNVDVAYLAQLLAFDDAQQAEKFLTDQGCVFVAGTKRLDCKQSFSALKKAPLRVRRCKK